MEKELKINNDKYYYCEICKLVYRQKKYAKKCKDWCKKNKSCSLEITRHSTKKTLEDLKDTFILN